MLKKLFILFLVNTFFLVNINFLYPQENLSLDTLIQEVKNNNPEIKAAKLRWEASLARVPRAKSPDDPVIGFTFEKAKGSPFQLKKTMPEDRMLSLTQMIPWFSKLSLKGKIALVESQMMASDFKNKELEVINDLKNSYFDLFMNYKEIELNQQSLNFLENIAKVAEAKYIVGEFSQEELFKINLEIAKLSNVILNLKAMQKSKETKINSLLSRNPESLLAMPVLNEDVNFNKDTNLLYELTLLNNPELSIFSYAIEKNKFEKSLAKRSFLPDLMAGIVMRGLFSGGSIGPWDLMLAFTLPLWFWTKQRYEVKEAIINLDQAQAAYEAMKNKTLAETKDLYTKIEITKNKINLYKTSLIPLLESSIRSSLAAFRSGKGDFMMLLDNQRMLIETKMNYFQALVEYNMNLADLERQTGVEFE